MFDHIGSKIKIVAQVIAWIGILASVIGGIVFMALTESPPGFLVMIAVPLVSWLSSLTRYGFGQQIENTDILAGREASAASRPAPDFQAGKEAAAGKTAVLRDLREKGLITEEEYHQKMENRK